MNFNTQKKRFQKNWDTHSPKFGTKTWKANPDFLYFIEIPIPTSIQKEMKEVCLSLESLAAQKKNWISAKEMKITLALPGRLGVHFQGNDVKFMEKTLAEICQKTPSFEVVLGNLNCFPNVVFREVYDMTDTLYDLHKEICETIPFTQYSEYQFENYFPHVSLLYADKSSADFLSAPEFDRKLALTEMKAEKIVFGKARNDKGSYEKEVLKIFSLKK